MSGHSKWATIKHKKGAADAKRGKLFAKLIKQVEVAARQGGGDVDTNPGLRTMFQKARDNSVPIDTIERAVKRGTGELEGVNYEPLTYEGYAPGGVALLIETLTDNRNRTGSEIRSLLSKNGGSLAEPGAVSWQFDRKGIVTLARTDDEDEIMMVGLEHGAEDVLDLGEAWQVVCEAGDETDLRAALVEAGLSVEESDTTMMAQNTVPVDDPGVAGSAMRLIELVDDHDDVQEIYSNIDLSDEIIAKISEED